MRIHEPSRSDHSDQIKASVKAAYSAIAAEFDQTRKQPWGEFEEFLRYVKKGDRVLDVGCGNGRLYDFFRQKKAEVEYVGVDHNPEFLKLAKQNFPEADFREGELENPNVPEDHFDAIFCIAAFHHLPDRASRRKAVEAIHRALKKDGVLILTVWNLLQWKYWRGWLRAIGHHLTTFGRRLKWNDLWIKWGKSPLPRYYHSFFPGELRRYFPESDWKVEELFFVRKGKRVSFWESFNMILIVRRK